MLLGIRRIFLFSILSFFFFNLYAQEEPKQEEPKFNAIYFLRDLLDDKYPVRIDFGAEPHRHGSMVFASVDYDWSDGFAQRFRIEYDHYTTSTTTTSSLAKEEVRSITVTPFPLVLFYGDSSIDAKSRFTQFQIGIYYRYSVLKGDTGAFFSLENNTDTRSFFQLDSDVTSETISGFLLNGSIQKYHIIGPALGYSLNVPLHKYISATFEGFFVPAFIVSMQVDSDTTYYLNEGQTVYSDGSTEYRSLSFPLVQQTIAIDFFRYVRLKALMSYQHLDLRAIGSGDDDIESYSLHTITLRYGGEILKPSKNTRKKSAHLWAGLYYEMSWNKSYIQDYYTSEYTGKWVLCFGK